MRIDLYLSANGYTKSRSHAKVLIDEGAVIVDGATVTKPSYEIDESTEHEIEITKNEKYVGRGGLKLEAALNAFIFDVAGCDALDIGASTGGFTDCLLKHGAKTVIAVDSGEGQLDQTLVSDKRVTNIEKYNARFLSRELVINGVDIAVMDVSFISQTLILPNISDILRDNGCLISLIKPQFEAGRSAVGKGGIVKSKKDRLSAVERVKTSAESVGLIMTDLIVSPIKGGDGNVEYLAMFKRLGDPISDNKINNTVMCS